MTNVTKPEIGVRFLPSTAELLEGYKAAAAADGSGSGLLYLNLFLISIIAAACFQFDQSELGIFFVIVLAAVAANSFWWAPRRAIRKYMAFTPGAESEVSMQLSHEGVRVSNSVIDSKVSWQGISRARETRSFFVLYRGYQPMVIPKRAMDEARLAAMRQLLAEKLPRKQK
jgi:hypothetical protein